MSDLWLSWYTIEGDKVTITRQEVRQLSEALGLPLAIMTRGTKISAFRKACTTTHSYVDDQGRSWTLRGVQAKSSGEFITNQVQREDGFKVAEFKFFQSRRTRSGVVKGTHLVRTMLRAKLEPADRAAAEVWLEQARAVFDSIQEDAPHRAVRLQARAAMMMAGTPVLNRESMYFFYDDEIDSAHRARQFLHESAPGSEFVLVSIEDHSDYTVFAVSADAHLCALLNKTIVKVQERVDNGQHPSDGIWRNWYTAIEDVRRLHSRHERRLGLQLPGTRSTLLVADRLMQEIPRPASLPKVIVR